jgi:S-formylglutathione hydrolase FrmB
MGRERRSGERARIIGERQVTGRAVELTIATPAFVAPTKVDVNLPAGYDASPSRRWPVTYFTAGTMNRRS